MAILGNNPREMPLKRSLNIVGERVRLARQRRTPSLTQDELSGQVAAFGIQLDRPAISKIEGDAIFAYVAETKIPRGEAIL